MHRPHTPHVRPFLFVGSLLLFIASTWDAGWTVATSIGLSLCWGWWVVGTLCT